MRKQTGEGGGEGERERERERRGRWGGGVEVLAFMTVGLYAPHIFLKCNHTRPLIKSKTLPSSLHHVHTAKLAEKLDITDSVKPVTPPKPHSQ